MRSVTRHDLHLARENKGENASIRRKQRPLAEKEAKSIWVRPPGYFNNSYDKADVRRQNRLAKCSVIRVPEDLE